MKAADSRLRVGFLTYDLQRNTEDALFEVAQAAPFSVKAFPLYAHGDQAQSRVAYRPATARAKHLGVNVKGSTPEGFVSNPEWRVGLDCARESDIVVLKGLLGLGAILCAFCARLLGRPVISTNQTLPVAWERRRRWWVRLSKRLLLRLCRYHIYQSPASYQVLTEVYGCSPDRVISAPYEAGASLFRRILGDAKASGRTKHDFGLDADTVFLYAGNLHAFKGVADIVRAAALLAGDESFLCVFAGPEEPASKDGATIEHFMRIARSIGVERRVRFLGPVTPQKLAELYMAADAVLLPTHKDCFPKVLVEAGLAGKPLVTTSACGSAGLIVQDCVNGFLIEPGDVSQLAQAMIKLHDPALRATMGACSKEIVDRCCRMDLEVQGYIEAVQRCTARVHLAQNA
ncbi:MAG TPA: glycosyltransferase family 4 protein [Terracidiphilus sp.]|nr:glycosyltransferase family 4 protein [Terracidiphilus sp.]